MTQTLFLGECGKCGMLNPKVAEKRKKSDACEYCGARLTIGIAKGPQWVDYRKMPDRQERPRWGRAK